MYAKDLHNVHFSLNMRVTKSRSMRYLGHVACMGETRNAYKIFVGKI